MGSMMINRQPLLCFPEAVRHAPEIDAWLAARGALGALAQTWFARMRGCGADVRELLHDGHPTACVGAAAFGYVNVFTAHVNVGFFRGAELPDPQGLLQGSGRFMRHVKLRPGAPGGLGIDADADADADALGTLIRIAYTDMRQRLAAHSSTTHQSDSP